MRREWTGIGYEGRAAPTGLEAVVHTRSICYAKAVSRPTSIGNVPSTSVQAGATSCYPRNRLKHSTALWPPKPQEFESAYSTSRCTPPAVT